MSIIIAKAKATPSMTTAALAASSNPIAQKTGYGHIGKVGQTMVANETEFAMMWGWVVLRLCCAIALP
jgi:hypothetical protein